QLGPNARLWKTYLHEMTRIDSQRIEDWKDSLDSLLVFAGLFSAVITSAVIRTFTIPHKNSGANANLNKESVHTQQTILGEWITQQILPSLGPSSLGPHPLDAVIKPLWLLSLILNFCTALGTILCKQWIHQYTIMPLTSCPRDQARIRHYKFLALEKWRVPTIIRLLPTCVHLSMGVFFVGLALFL
ncbi:hypothetical protein K435DRAFT_589965, partial [Dendrothele bispora CBS 962.96]